MKLLVGILAVVLGLALILSFAFGTEWLGLKWKGYFAPKHATVERAVFKETRSYNEGKLQDLTRLRLQYLRAKSADDKEALASTIRLQFADYDEEKLPNELRVFLSQIKYGH